MSYGVMVSTTDFESVGHSSNLCRTAFVSYIYYFYICIKNIMGVIKHFSSDSRDYNKCNYEKENNFLPNPNPKKFIIKKFISINGYSVLLVNYPDCINYEGNKILVYDKKINVHELAVTKGLDPHFYNAGDSPIARFEPTPRGWKLAIKFIENI